MPYFTVKEVKDAYRQAVAEGTAPAPIRMLKVEPPIKPLPTTDKKVIQPEEPIEPENPVNSPILPEGVKPEDTATVDNAEESAVSGFLIRALAYPARDCYTSLWSMFHAENLVRRRFPIFTLKKSSIVAHANLMWSDLAKHLGKLPTGGLPKDLDIAGLFYLQVQTSKASILLDVESTYNPEVLSEVRLTTPLTASERNHDIAHILYHEMVHQAAYEYFLKQPSETCVGAMLKMSRLKHTADMRQFIPTSATRLFPNLKLIGFD